MRNERLSRRSNEEIFADVFFTYFGPTAAASAAITVEWPKLLAILAQEGLRRAVRGEPLMDPAVHQVFMDYYGAHSKVELVATLKRQLVDSQKRIHNDYRRWKRGDDLRLEMVEKPEDGSGPAIFETRLPLDANVLTFGDRSGPQSDRSARLCLEVDPVNDPVVLAYVSDGAGREGWRQRFDSFEDASLHMRSYGDVNYPALKGGAC